MQMPLVQSRLTLQIRPFAHFAHVAPPQSVSLSVPSGTPGDSIRRLNKAVNEVLAQPDFVTRARAMGMEPRGGTPEELAKFVQTEFERWVPMLKSLNLPKQSH